MKAKLESLNNLFGTDFITTSAKTGTGLESLRDIIDKTLIELTAPSSESSQNATVITARHKQAVTEAIENIDNATEELNAGSDELTAIMLRAAYQNVSNIEQHDIDEQILKNIFVNFCIGK